MRLSLSGVLLIMISIISVHAQDTSNFPTIGKVVRNDSRLDQFLAKDAKIEVIASGLDWSEGPVWVQEGEKGYLLFSDIPRNSVMKWEEGVGLTLFMKPSGYTGVEDYGREPGSNGIALDAEGRLVFCEHGDRRISVLTKHGGKMTIADRWQGKRFNSPNDLAIKSNGDIYFTDPIYGLRERQNDPNREIDFCGVYRVRPGTGEVILLTKEFNRPNGLAFSPDEKTLYIGQSDVPGTVVKSFPVKEDGTLGEGKILHDFTKVARELRGAPDGMKVDEKGNLWTTGPGGVNVVTPTGTVLGRIETGESISNCAWGNDGSMLYMTSDMYLCRIQTLTRGANWGRNNSM